MVNVKELKVVSSLEKIYPGDEIPAASLESFTLLRNEKKSFQVAVKADGEGEMSVDINTKLDGIKVYTVEQIKSDFPMWKKGADDYYRFSETGYYPDLLLPSGDKVSTKENEVKSLWFEVDADGNESGVYSVEITVGDKSVSVEVEIIDAELDFSDFVYTCWFHTDCLMSHYGFDAFSDEYWRVTENFLKTAREYGMNCVLTPIFTPALDTQKGKERPTVQLIDVTVTKGVYTFNFDKLTRWIDMAHRCKVEYFELAHFYTQWGARYTPKVMATVDGEYKRIFGWDTRANSRKYKAFLIALSVELKKYLEEKNLKDKVLIHVSDEPHAPCHAYKRASRHIHSLYEGYKIVDALSDFSFYKKKIVSNPIPANDHIDHFLGKVENLWVYYCSAQKSNYVSNRFFCNSSLRTRVIGYQMYKFDIKGFLHWGYNFYYTRLSKGVVDPFEVTDAGKEFPSGDSYIVYPAKDGTAYHSIRLKVFYDALQDMAALKALEKLTDKKTCLDIIEQEGKHSLTFSNYPHDETWLLETREAVNRAIKANI